MRVIPAVDLRDGACVQLVGGSFEREALRLSHPLAAATRWRDAGFRELHVVDLDAAVSGDRRVNGAIVRRLLAESGMRTQVGGGVRETCVVEELLGAGAERVIAGTRALEDPEWLGAVASRWPGRVVAAVDVSAGKPVVRGWRATASRSLDETLAAVAGLSLAAVLVTSVDVEGRMGGPDVALFERVLARTPLPLIASGGVGDVTHLRTLRAIGVASVVVGMALYTGALDARHIAEEFSA